MKRTALVICAALLVLLLLVNVHLAYSTANTSANQTVGHAKMSDAPVGTTLQVYISGDRALAAPIQAELQAALQAKDLPFAQVHFSREIPTDSRANPFLAIFLTQDHGLWTPVYATRHVQATLYYDQGELIDRAQVLAAAANPLGMDFVTGGCTGDCAEGRRTINLDARSAGLVSLPYMRAYVAGKLAEEAATLVADGLPEHLNPAKWQDRATKLALAKLGGTQGGAWATFARLTGCRGGIATVGYVGSGGNWRLMYYDAAQDAITQVLARSELQAQLPGSEIPDNPGFGSDKGAWTLYLGGRDAITFPAGTCGLSGWQRLR